MTAIELPAMGGYPVSSAGAAEIHNQLRNSHNIEVGGPMPLQTLST